MRNIVIIAICGLLIAGAGALILFSDDLFGSDDRRESSASRDERDEDRDRDRDAESSTRDEDDGSGSSAESGEERLSAAVESELRSAVDHINANTPMRIDPLTQMTSARLDGRRIVYRYDIARELTDEQADDFRELATRQNRETICNNADARNLFDVGAEVEYEYYDPSGDYLFSTPITSC